jgi:hypothetical protein
MNFSKHTEPSCGRHHRAEAPASGIRALWRLVRRPRLLNLCFAVAAVIAIQAGLGTPEAAPPGGGGLIAKIQQLAPLHGALRVGDTVRLAAAGVTDTQAHFSWRLVSEPPTSRAKISDHNGLQASFVADVPGVYVVELMVRVGSRSATAELSVTPTCATDPLTAVNTINVVNGQQGMTVGSCFIPDNSNGTQFHVVVLDRNTLGAPDNYNYNFTEDSNGVSQMASLFSSLTDADLVFLAQPNDANDNNIYDSLNSALAEIGGVLRSVEWDLDNTGFCWASNTPQCGSQWTGLNSYNTPFSMIGVPGMSAGNAWYNDAGQQEATTPTTGPLIGYLTPGVTVPPPGSVVLPTVGAYSFVFGADQYVVVDSCVSGGPSACVIGVGYNEQQGTWQDTCAPEPGVPNGLNVMVLDRLTLKKLVCETVAKTTGLVNAIYGSDTDYQIVEVPNGTPSIPPTGAPDPIPLHAQEGNNAGGTQGGWLTDQVVVVIESVGTGMITYADDAALQLIDQLGGTPETFAAAITQGQPYALIGVASNLPWHGRGIESSPVINSLEPGQSRGVLSKDRVARYTPQADDPTGLANLELSQIVYQNPTPWPYTYDESSTASTDSPATQQQVVAGYTAAIAYIADSLSVGYCDIRSGYPDTNITWSLYVSTSVSYPQNSSTSPPSSAKSTNPNTCSSYYSSYTSTANPNYTSFPDQGTFSSILSQLQTEFGYVTGVRTLIANLESPFTYDEAANDNLVATVATNVYNSVNPPTSSEVNLFWLNLFDGVMGVLSETSIPDASVFGLVGDSGALAALLIGNSSTASGGPGSSANNILTEAEQLSGQLNNQYQAHIDALGQLENILVGDYGKLQTVGQDLTTPAWTWNGTTTTANAATALGATTVQAVYSALLPPTWQVYSLKPDLVTEFSSANVATFQCSYEQCTAFGCNPPSLFTPFSGALSANQFQSRIQMTTSGSVETSNLEVWTFGFVDGGSFTHGGDISPPVTLPSTSLTTTLFSTITAGGAAAYPPAWYRQTYNPPSHVVCSKNWNENNTPSPTTNNAQAPVVIGPDAANETGG